MALHGRAPMEKLAARSERATSKMPSTSGLDPD
jgi:hypothetical protein